MAKYKTIRDCYFQSRFYKAGQEASFADGIEVPKHFAAVGSAPAKEAEAKEAEKAAAADAEPKTMHELAKSKSVVAEPSVKAKKAGKAGKADAKEAE